tara:strand:- start:2036 stop:2785 length:750 start_codon:yes stop_codon:yes gene_type:complete
MNKLFNSYVIAMDKKSKRYRQYLLNNPHIKAEFFQGIKVLNITEKEKISLGILSEDNPIQITDGEAGCALSHRKLWELTANNEVGSLILEDDIITHKKLIEFININYHEIMRFDIIFFSVNTDSILESISPEGVHTLKLFANRYPSQDQIKETLNKTNLNEVRIDKLLKSFGSSAYFISPKGADILKKYVFPFKGTAIKIPLKDKPFYPTGIDSEVLRYLENLNAIVCNPLLAYTPNQNSTTTLKRYKL